MSVVFQRYLGGGLGVAQNLFFPGDCGGIKYLMIHVGSWRVTLTWKERERRQYPSVSTCGYMRG
jgi:hypothetical protein